MSSSQDINERPLGGQESALGRPLHPTAEALFRYIVRYKREHAGESPTRRELAAEMTTSTSVISYHLTALEKAGKVMLSSKSGTSRMIGIPGAEWRLAGGQESALPEPNGNHT